MLEILIAFVSGGVSYGLLKKLISILWEWYKRQDNAKLSIESEVATCLRDPVDYEGEPEIEMQDIPKEIAEQLGIQEAETLQPGETIEVPFQVPNRNLKMNAHYFCVWVHNNGRKEAAENCQAELTYLSPHRAMKTPLGRGSFTCWQGNWSHEGMKDALYAGRREESVDIQPGGRAELAFVLRTNGLDFYPHPEAERIRNMSFEEYVDFYPTRVKLTITSDNAPATSRVFKIEFSGDGFYIRSQSEEWKRKLRRLYGYFWRAIVRPIRLRLRR